ncbi:hypothetical protein BFJ68_g6216 [Fusarium oxysporum]|uniref:Uncharacterized protein n=2 Tax=Fusarium oxysporum TaxID=5507 RepID=A0A420RCA3_FUSOX|nr:hypothetical protein BFJ65_g5000 [Fusarium oxysporum f. sp. cepae]RKL14660.1 hypothetical protein BFJ68_g6216 [Fusarium oxysporum]
MLPASSLINVLRNASVAGLFIIEHVQTERLYPFALTFALDSFEMPSRNSSLGCPSRFVG